MHVTDKENTTEIGDGKAKQSSSPLADYYQLRAEDCAGNFHSLRAVEWPLAFQAYAGYTAIAMGFTYLADSKSFENLIGIFGTLAALALIALYLITLYASLRIQERMHDARDKTNFYIARLRDSVAPIESFSEPGDPPAGDKRGHVFQMHTPPIHARHYAFYAQQAVGVLWALGVLGYVMLRTAMLLPCH